MGILRVETGLRVSPTRKANFISKESINKNTVVCLIGKNRKNGNWIKVEADLDNGTYIGWGGEIKKLLILK